MKDKLVIWLVVSVIGLTIWSNVQGLPVPMTDANHSQVKSGIDVSTTTSETTFPGGINVTNGTVKVQGTNATWSSGIAKNTSAGAADAGKVPLLNASGVLDSTIIGSSAIQKYATNIFLGANFTVAASAVNTNVMTYTTTLGSNALVSVHAQLAYSGAGDHETWRLTADGFEPLGNISDKASTANYGNEHPGQLHYNLLLTSNVTIRVQASATAAAGGTIYRNLTSSGTGTPSVTNVTYMTIQEIK